MSIIPSFYKKYRIDRSVSVEEILKFSEEVFKVLYPNKTFNVNAANKALSNPMFAQIFVDGFVTAFENNIDKFGYSLSYIVDPRTGVFYYLSLQ